MRFTWHSCNPPLHLPCYLGLQFNTRALTGHSPAVLTHFSSLCRMNIHARVPYQVPGWEICLLSTNLPTRTVFDSRDDFQSPSRMYLKLQINIKEEKLYFFPFFSSRFHCFPWLACIFLHTTFGLSFFITTHRRICLWESNLRRKLTVLTAEEQHWKYKRWAMRKGRQKRLS